MAASIIATLTAQAGQFHSEMAKADAEMAKLGTSGSGNMQKLQAAGKAAFIGIAGAAAVGVGVAIKAAGDYQESLTALVTGAGESEANIKLVGDGMLHMAGQVGISAMDLSKGMYLIESAGYHGANGLTVLKAAAEGARVGGADMATVADGLTTALNDYHMPASAAADVTSKLVATVAAGKTHMQDLAGALASVLPAASSAHVGLDQVLGAMATMTAGGTPAADAATYLRQTILQLSNPTAKAALEMKNLGLSSIDISSHLGQRGLTGTLDLLTGAIEKHMGPAGTVLIDTLQKAAGKTSTFQQVLANLPPTQQTYISALATMVGGTKSMQAALELTGGNAKTFAANVKSIGGATAEAGGNVKGFALTQEDLNTKVANLKAAFGALEIEIGQKLIPIVSSAITWFAKHRTEMVALAAVVTGVVAVAIGAYLVSALEKVSKALTLTGRAAQLFGVQAAEGEAAAELPLLPWIAAVALVGVAAYELYEHWNTVWSAIKDATSAVWSFIKPVFDVIVTYFQVTLVQPLQALGQAFATVWGAISTVVQTAWSLLQPVFDLLKLEFEIGIMLPLQLLGDAFKIVWALVELAVRTAWQGMKVEFDLLVAVFNDVIVPAVHGVETAFDVVWGAVRSAVSGAWGFVRPILDSIGSALSGPLTTAVNGVKTAFDTVWGGVKTAVSDAWNFIQPILQKIEDLANGVGSAISKVTGAVSGIAGAASTVTKGVTGFLGHLAGGGPARANTPYVIGEEGPEIFVPDASGVVLPNSALRGSAMRTPAGGTVEPKAISVDNTAVVAKLDELLAAIRAMPREQQRLARTA